MAPTHHFGIVEFSIKFTNTRIRNGIVFVCWYAQASHAVNRDRNDDNEKHKGSNIAYE